MKRSAVGIDYVWQTVGQCEVLVKELKAVCKCEEGADGD